MKTFEDQFMDIQIRMISLAMEFAGDQTDSIFIYGIMDGFFRFDVFYKIGKEFLQRDEIPFNLPENELDEIELNMLKYGTEDLEAIAELFQNNGRENPTEIWLTYDVKSNSLDAKYSYEGRYDKDDELLLDPVDEFEKWFEEVKAESSK